MKRYSQVHREILPRNLASFFCRGKLCKLEEGFVFRVLEQEGGLGRRDSHRNDGRGEDRVISKIRGGLMRGLLASGSYFHRGEDGTRSVIEHVETILTLPVKFLGERGPCIRSSKILLHAEVVAT